MIVQELRDIEAHLFEVYEEFDNEEQLLRFLEGASERPTATWHAKNVRYKGKILYWRENTPGYSSMELFEDLNEFYKQEKSPKAIHLSGPPLPKLVHH